MKPLKISAETAQTLCHCVLRRKAREFFRRSSELQGILEEWQRDYDLEIADGNSDQILLEKLRRLRTEAWEYAVEHRQEFEEIQFFESMLEEPGVA